MATQKQVDPEDLKAPNLALLALELRAPLEWGSLLPAWPLLAKAPHGDGHSVIIFPGLGANDITTAPLRKYLHHLGYRSEGWSQGFNFGPRAGVLERARAQLDEAFARSGGKVSLIGWSLGGVYARELAKQRPDKVRSVITLGTPFAGSPRSTNAWRLYELASGHSVERESASYRLSEAPPVPTTSVYSRSDGIVAWPASLQAVSAVNANTENVEVIASHLGLGLHPGAWWVVADRLAQAEGAWKPFEHKKGLHGLIFPDRNRSM